MNSDLASALLIARRELRGGLRGFRIFLGCIILGVTAIAAVGTVRDAIVTGLSEQGQELLAADMDFVMTSRPADKAAVDWLATQGNLAQTVQMRARGLVPGSRGIMIELKGVGDAYPLYGAVTLQSGKALQDQLQPVNGVPAAIVEPGVLEKLSLSVGDTLRVGHGEFVIRDVIVAEPDRATDGLTLGVRVMVSLDGLAASKLVQPGSLYRHHYLLALPAGADLEQIATLAGGTFPDAGWRIRDRTNGAPQVKRFVDRLTVFLSLVGLAALVVGGVGVGNAVTGYLATKREAIATLKSLGAKGDTIFSAYLMQMMALGALGIALGLVLGAVLPAAVLYFVGDMLPVPAQVGFYPAPLLIAAAYGVLAILVFTVWPLARARDIRAAELFRGGGLPSGGVPQPRYLVLLGASIAALLALALAYAEDVMFAGSFIMGTAVAFLMLLGLGLLVRIVARHVPRPRNTKWRLALASLHRPGSSTANIVLSLGLGLTLIATIALIEGNLRVQVARNLPTEAPAYFFVDIQPFQVDAMKQAVATHAPDGVLNMVPMLRGTIAEIGGRPAGEVDIAPEARWALRGDRGITYLAEQPTGSEVVAGDWWPADYDGPPLLSFDAQLAEGMGLSIGDTVSFNILGQPITATIANLRTIDWSTMGINFSIVFAPGALNDWPQSWLATLHADDAAAQRVDQAIAEPLPNVTAIRVKEVMDTMNDLLRKIGYGVSGAALVALIAGVLVLAGAMAAGYRERLRDAVILKVLGAARRDIALAYAIEYALLGGITALIAMGLGSLAALYVIEGIMQADFIFLPSVLLITVLGGMAIAVLFGFLGTWRVLTERAAAHLRAD